MYTILHIYTETFMHICARSQTEAICDTFVGHHCMGTQEFEAIVCDSPLYRIPLALNSEVGLMLLESGAGIQSTSLY